MRHSNQKSCLFFNFVVETFVNRKTAAWGCLGAQALPNRGCGRHPTGNAESSCSFSIQRSSDTTSCYFSHGWPYPADNSHGFWLMLCCLCPSGCFNDFQFLVNVLLNVNIAGIPYMPCFLLSIIFQMEFAPISSATSMPRSQIAMDSWTC